MCGKFSFVNCKWYDVNVKNAFMNSGFVNKFIYVYILACMYIQYMKVGVTK